MSNIDEFLETLTVHNKELAASFNDAVAVEHLKSLIAQAEKEARIDESERYIKSWGMSKVDKRVRDIATDRLAQLREEHDE